MVNGKQSEEKGMDSDGSSAVSWDGWDIRWQMTEWGKLPIYPGQFSF